MKTLKLVITGRVQGVFFRANTKNVAQKLGLCGRVWNTEDGNVEVEAQGDENKLNELIKWCHKGPDIAHVDNVNVEWFDQEEIYTGFNIKY